MGIFVTYIFCIWFNTKCHPEVHFWKTLGINKIEYSKQLSLLGKKKIHFVGGSSCTFSIRPDILKTYGLYSVNMGMHAGMGALFNVGFGISEVSPGDIIVLAIEPDTLNGRVQPTSLGINTAVSMGNKQWAVGGDLINRKLTYKEQINASRPGGRKIITHFFKFLLRIPPYRYNLHEADQTGWCSISYDLEQATPEGNFDKKYTLSENGKQLLKAVSKSAELKGAKVYYLAPWQLTKLESKDHNRSLNKQFLEEINQILPIINDNYFGVCTNPEWYADTKWHLTDYGSRIRTEALAEALIPILTESGWLKNNL